MKKAFITGIAGQDGSYLAEYLLEMGYEVHGIIRRNSVPENQQSRLEGVKERLHVSYGDLLDQSSIEHLLDKVQPDEVYNIAAQSHVRISYDIPQFTAQTNALGVLNVLEAYRRSCPTAKFYQASSSEMFGSSVDADGFQRETTPMTPVSPYGCTKVFGYNIVRNYRNAYKLHASNGILFNHESPRRGSNFVTNKVVKSAVEIYLGQRKDLVLGNLDAYRDWGHSKDYVRAMHLILQQPQAGDWVVATGETRSVRDMCEYVFSYQKVKMD
jgi:GDPmannose 4,6-dehydratase